MTEYNNPLDMMPGDAICRAEALAWTLAMCEKLDDSEKTTAMMVAELLMYAQGKAQDKKANVAA